MLTKSQQLSLEADAGYTPAQYLADLKSVTSKALASGVTLEQLAHATMGFATALWTECHGDERDMLLKEVMKKAPTWSNVGTELIDSGWISE